MIASPPPPRKKRKGFTLAELLIALAILGVIATFAIPKLLQAVSSSQQKAVLKETVSTISAAMQEGILKGTLNYTNVQSYFASKINAIKICNNASADGCWDPATQGGYPSVINSAAPGYVLANGVTLCGFSNINSSVNFKSIYIDANGISPPNQLGSDQLSIQMCFGPGNCTGPIDGSGSKVAGSIGADAYVNSGAPDASNTALFNSLFQ